MSSHSSPASGPASQRPSTLLQLSPPIASSKKPDRTGRSNRSSSISHRPTPTPATKAPSEEVKPVEEKQQEVKPEEPVAETEKPELTLKERVVGKWDFGGVTLIFDKNGTAKAMRGGNLIGGRTWFIKDGKIHTISDGPAKTVVIYVMNEDGNLQHPSRGEAKRIKTEDN